MARSATGAITILDIADGTDPIAAFLTNENHSFMAENDGTVSAATRQIFTSTVMVFVGQTAASYVQTLGTTNATFTIGTPTGAPTGWTIAVNATTGEITVSNITQAAADQAAIVIPITVRANNQNNTINLSLSLTKVRNGAGGAVVNLAPTKQYFTANSEGVLDAGQANVVMAVDSSTEVGAIRFFTSLDGGSFVARTATGTGVGQISGYSTAATSPGPGGTFSTGNFPTTGSKVTFIRITQDNLGDSNEVLTVQAQGDVGETGLDAVSVVKVREGAQGAAALNITITSSNGGNTFKNNAGTNKTLTANVIDQTTGAAPTGTIAYQWAKDGTNVGTNSATLVVTAADITDNGSNEYTCTVSVTP